MPPYSESRVKVMKRMIGMLAFGALLLSPAPVPAEDPPYLDFVHGLRAKGYPDLAVAYLQKLQAHPPAGLPAQDLSLEIAMAGVDAAAMEPDLVKRDALFVSA